MTRYELNDVLVVDDCKKNIDIMRSIVERKDQENAFYILDVGWVARRHYDWINKMPRVMPYYGALKVFLISPIILIVIVYSKIYKFIFISLSQN